jgi:glycosyltransferase involved in cell wall biosynthesis
LKILHVEGGRNFYGGAQQVLYLMQGLSERGVDNVSVCPTGSELSRRAAPCAQVGAIPMAGDLDVRLIWRLGNVIRSARPDLVHLQSRIGADVMGGIAARVAGVPVVHSRRVDNPESRWVVASKYRLHDRVVAISEAIGRVLLAEGFPQAKLRCVHDAVDAGLYRGRRDRAWLESALGVPENSPVIAVVAQLIGRKGHRFLLRAMPRLIQRFPSIRLIFFGKGPLGKELSNTVEREGLRDHVDLAGFREDLPRILPCLDLLVHPALAEGLGVSLLQAACAGVPIVAFRAGGVPEVVRDGINGLLVEPGDVDGLASAIEALLEDPRRSRALGLAGRALAEQEFSVDRMVEGNLAVYSELLGVQAG